MKPATCWRGLWCALTLAWAAVVGGGFVVLAAYALTPGEAHDPPARWPAGSRLVPDPNRANLVLLAHPRCPCTRASIAELERIMSRCSGRVTAHVAFFRPKSEPESWAKTDLWRTAAGIPGVKVATDEDGAESARFGAATSGQVLLFDQSGLRVFAGGITPARGHEGDNAGLDAIVSRLSGGEGLRQTAVFGCPLVESNLDRGRRAAECRR